MQVLRNTHTVTHPCIHFRFTPALLGGFLCMSMVKLSLPVMRVTCIPHVYIYTIGITMIQSI